MKPCSKCKQDKALSEFRQYSPNKYRGACKDCEKKSSREYRQSHRAEVKESLRKYNESHRIERATFSREYYWAHTKEIAEQSRKYSQTPEGRLTNGKGAKKYRLDHPEKTKAHDILNHAVRAGKLERPDTCEDCSKKRKVHGHHEDYDKPLEVDWLCQACHIELHRLLREKEMAEDAIGACTGTL